jgi:CDP-diacylglycerol--glycerol-3-phosphate 3-phosphatidyltransferase
VNIPNYLTVLRILLIPIFLGFFYLPFQWSHYLSAVVFSLAAITDWLDGYLARTLGATSSLGAFLDPVADKLLVAVALILLVSSPHLPYITIPSCIIVGREIVISALREWMAEIGKRTSVAVSYVGKFKTAVQMVAIIVLLAYTPQLPFTFLVLGYVCLYSAAVLTLWTMVMYLQTAWPNFHFEKEGKKTLSS